MSEHDIEFDLGEINLASTQLKHAGDTVPTEKRSKIAHDKVKGAQVIALTVDVLDSLVGPGMLVAHLRTKADDVDLTLQSTTILSIAIPQEAEAGGTYTSQSRVKSNLELSKYTGVVLEATARITKGRLRFSLGLDFPETAA